MCLCLRACSLARSLTLACVLLFIFASLRCFCVCVCVLLDCLPSRSPYELLDYSYRFWAKQLWLSLSRRELNKFTTPNIPPYHVTHPTTKRQATTQTHTHTHTPSWLDPSQKKYYFQEAEEEGSHEDSPQRQAPYTQAQAQAQAQTATPLIAASAQKPPFFIRILGLCVALLCGWKVSRHTNIPSHAQMR